MLAALPGFYGLFVSGSTEATKITQIRKNKPNPTYVFRVKAKHGLMILQGKKKKSFKFVKFCFAATKFDTEVAEYEKAD